MAESHVVSGLVAKRAELAGQIEAHRRELAQLEAHVEHLDGAIKLFAPDYKLEGIRAKPPRRRNRFFLQSAIDGGRETRKGTLMARRVLDLQAGVSTETSEVSP